MLGAPAEKRELPKELDPFRRYFGQPRCQVVALADDLGQLLL